MFLSVRRDLCNWTKAMQLRYNVSQIEEFLSRRHMREATIIQELNPLVQSSQLLQVKKQDEKDAVLLLQMCENLSGAQVCNFADFDKNAPYVCFLIFKNFNS